jgi:HK97 family phage prohead protease
MNKELTALLEKLGLTGRSVIVAKDTEGNEFLCSEAKETQELTHIFSDAEFKQICEENGFAHPSSLEPEEKRAEYESALKETKKPVMDQTRIIVFRGSDETADRSGDIIRVAGWDLTEYKKNPVFLWGHDYSKAPVGRTVKVWKENNDSGAKNGKSLMFAVYFPTAEENAESDSVFKLYKAKLLSSVSVGFMPVEMNYPQSQEEREKMGLGKYGVEYKKQMLWELSAVPVPANPNANLVTFGQEDKSAPTKEEQETVELEKRNLVLRITQLEEQMTKLLSQLDSNVGGITPKANEGSEELQGIKSVVSQLISQIKQENKHV